MVVKPKKTAYIMVGLPGSGKSTWRFDKLKYTPIPTGIVSSDDHIEDAAKKRGTTYNDIFKDYAKTAMYLMHRDLENFISEGMDIIWDQTNLNVKSRAAKLAKIPDDYEKVAVVFCLPLEKCLQRNAKRERSIPDHIIRNMHESFEMPTFEEGFDHILRIGNCGS